MKNSSMPLMFTLPWPPAGLSPNARLHHMALYRLKKSYRAACGWAAIKQGAKRLTVEPGARVVVHLQFNPPDRRARDEDNLIAAMKSGLDGLADALQVDDKRFQLSHELTGQVAGTVVVTIKEL